MRLIIFLKIHLLSNRRVGYLRMNCSSILGWNGRGGFSSAPTGGGGGGDTQGGEWGFGVRWTVELKLNRKKRKNWIPTGGCNPSTPSPSRSATEWINCRLNSQSDIAIIRVMGRGSPGRGGNNCPPPLFISRGKIYMHPPTPPAITRHINMFATPPPPPQKKKKEKKSFPCASVRVLPLKIPN